MTERTIREYEDVSEVDDDELRDLLTRASASRAEYAELDDPEMVAMATSVLERFLDEISIRAAGRDLDQWGVSLFLPGGTS